MNPYLTVIINHPTFFTAELIPGGKSAYFSMSSQFSLNQFMFVSNPSSKNTSGLYPINLSALSIAAYLIIMFLETFDIRRNGPLCHLFRLLDSIPASDTPGKRRNIYSVTSLRVSPENYPVIQCVQHTYTSSIDPYKNILHKGTLNRGPTRVLCTYISLSRIGS